MKAHLFFIALISSSSAFGFEVPYELREKYSDLYNKELKTHPDGSKEFGDARLFMRQGIRVLSLKGDRFEMAFQHGKLLKNEIPQGALPKIAAMIQNAAKNSFPDIPAIVDPIIEGIYRNYSRSILKHSSQNMGISQDEYLLEAYGLAEGSGYKLDKVVYAFLSPEILQLILGQQMRGSKNLPSPQMATNCTDFAIPPHQTATDDYIIGRNTDYSLSGYFDKYPTVVYYHPTDGAQNYMSITSAGLHTAGVVGYNQSGIYLGVHTIPTWDTSMQGHPVFDVGQFVLRNAKNLDEALEIFKSMPPAAGWAYTLVSSKEYRSASIELSNNAIAIRETSGDAHIQTNHFIDSSMISRNLDINATINEDTRARYTRTENLITASSELFNHKMAARILGDKIDPQTNKVRGIGNVVATNMTVTSAVLDIGRKSLYLGNGLAPTSLTQFVELPLIERFDVNSFPNESFETFGNGDYHQNHPSISKAEQLYIKAKNAFELDLDAKTSLRILGEVVTSDPDNAAYHFMRGLMAIKTGETTTAYQALNTCSSLQEKHYRLACNYFIARLDGNSGNYQDAIERLKSIIQTAQPSVEAPLIRAVNRTLKQLYRTRRSKLNPDTLSIFMPEADVVAY